MGNVPNDNCCEEYSKTQSKIHNKCFLIINYKALYNSIALIIYICYVRIKYHSYIKYHLLNTFNLI